MQAFIDKLGSIIDAPAPMVVLGLLIAAAGFNGKISVTAGQILVVIGWLVAIVWLRNHPWPILVGWAAILGGAFLLYGYWLRPDLIPKYSGILVPKIETLVSKGKPATTRKFEIGDSGGGLTYAGPEEMPLFKFLETFKVTLELVNGKLKISTDVRDSGGDLIAELKRNEWKVAPPPKTFDRNYTNDALEVRDAKGKIVLQVRVLPDRIQLQGEWCDPVSGLAVRLVSRGPTQGGLIIRSDQPDFNKYPIRPMFQYPSETHFGQLRDGR